VPRRRGLAAPGAPSVRGETYAYCSYGGLGTSHLARKLPPLFSRANDDHPDRLRWRYIAFVEVRTRLAVKGKPALPELSITKEKHAVPSALAHYFLRERHLKECPLRFDVWRLTTSRQPPAVRLHRQLYAPRRVGSGWTITRTTNAKFTLKRPYTCVLPRAKIGVQYRV